MFKSKKNKPVRRIVASDLECPHCQENSLQLINPDIVNLLNEMERYTEVKMISGYLCPIEARKRGLRDTDSCTTGNVAVLSYNNSKHLYDLIWAACTNGARQIHIYKDCIKIGMDDMRQMGVWLHE